ncbi:MAG: Smr/MutS family protein [Vicinamibacterales bacterium]
MPFSIGDHVHLANLGTGVVREVRNGGRYVVEVKGRAIVANHSQLSLADSRKLVRTPPSAPALDNEANRGRVHCRSEVDLHGMTTIEAIAALDAFLNEAMLAGHDEVRVIHGRSGGRIKAAVHQRLSAFGSIRGFHVDARNSGVTIVAL